ncbi:MAG: thermonuclease family protein [Candidatus Omnitrophica bacterium]|nr:thermonuclease family protein [Candidatus Omnitrophota bacterium]
MPTQIVTLNKNSLQSYGELKKRIRETIALGKERALQAVERERVKTAWETGKLINDHILFNKARADYGQQVIKRLSADLEISNTELKYMLQFARSYPIGPSTDQLNWGQYRELLSINDDKKRSEMTKEAARNNWTQKELRREIKKIKTANPASITDFPEGELLVPIQGDLDTYRIVTGEAGPWQGKSVLDLGFSNYLELDSKQAEKFKERNIIKPLGDNQISKDNASALLGSASLVHVPDKTEADIFTYRAYVIEVTDGDTIWLLIDLGFGITTKQHVRLRGLDAPEINTHAGIEAKKFVERELKKVSSIIITSTKSDKYDRYLVDIFYETKTGEQFLNNKLLQADLAERVD